MSGLGVLAGSIDRTAYPRFTRMVPLEDATLQSVHDEKVSGRAMS